MKRFAIYAPFFALVVAAAPAWAQTRDGDDKVPPDQRPPPGMCRIWLDNVPAGQQPAPTDCATAVRNRPPNGRVIFGDEPRSDRRGGGPKPKKLRQPPGTSRGAGRQAIGGRETGAVVAPMAGVIRRRS